MKYEIMYEIVHIITQLFHNDFAPALPNLFVILSS